MTTYLLSVRSSATIFATIFVQSRTNSCSTRRFSASTHLYLAAAQIQTFNSAPAISYGIQLKRFFDLTRTRSSVTQRLLLPAPVNTQLHPLSPSRASCPGSNPITANSRFRGVPTTVELRATYQVCLRRHQGCNLNAKTLSF